MPVSGAFKAGSTTFDAATLTALRFPTISGAGATRTVDCSRGNGAVTWLRDGEEVLGDSSPSSARVNHQAAKPEIATIPIKNLVFKASDHEFRLREWWVSQRTIF